MTNIITFNNKNTVGDGHKGPLNNQRKLTFFRKKQNANELKTHLRQNSLSYGSTHGPDGPDGSPTLEQNSAPLEGRGTIRANFRLARGLGAPLERGSASLEGRSLLG
jgi:hypothetical protein